MSSSFFTSYCAESVRWCLLILTGCLRTPEVGLNFCVVLGYGWLGTVLVVKDVLKGADAEVVLSWLCCSLEAGLLAACLVTGFLPDRSTRE